MTTLTPGQRMTGLELKLQPQAVIAGRVLDEHGEPVARVTVMAMSYSYTQGGRQLSPRSSASTNDLGEYRAFGLPPGRYYIAATYSNVSVSLNRRGSLGGAAAGGSLCDDLLSRHDGYAVGGAGGRRAWSGG